ncbi:uncharacterized protein VTP21DRAFT_3426 [Calcarisporiella thermophila]|uniref:uncharacterized protein n=1 Tax=Calcarisporiella thermophila TaxID=911321 RepID=UPI0037447D93
MFTNGKDSTAHASAGEDGFLFPLSLISEQVKAVLPSGYKLRPLHVDDYDKGFLECLSQLSTVGEISKEEFILQFRALKKAGDYYTAVIEEPEGRVIACGTLLVERKFLHQCGKAGHIEDVIVHDSQRGKKLGLMIVDQLKHLGRETSCYKVILNCAQRNVEFYEKCGLKLKDYQMCIYF